MANEKAARQAVKLALGYLRVCHLANHAGCMVKVDQAVRCLEAAQVELRAS